MRIKSCGKVTHYPSKPISIDIIKCKSRPN
jgi:hypothetical protein